MEKRFAPLPGLPIRGSNVRAEPHLLPGRTGFWSRLKAGFQRLHFIEILHMSVLLSFFLLRMVRGKTKQDPTCPECSHNFFRLVLLFVITVKPGTPRFYHVCGFWIYVDCARWIHVDLSKSQLENHYASVFGRPLPRVILVLLYRFQIT